MDRTVTQSESRKELTAKIEKITDLRFQIFSRFL
jgi:hypothetical protein